MAEADSEDVASVPGRRVASEVRRPPRAPPGPGSAPPPAQMPRRMVDPAATREYVAEGGRHAAAPQTSSGGGAQAGVARPAWLAASVMRGLLAVVALWLEQVRGRRCTPRRILMAAAAGAALFMGVVLFAQGTRLVDGSSGPSERGPDGRGPPIVRAVPSMCHRVQYFLQARPVAGAVNCRWRVVNGAHLDLAHCRVRLQRSLLGAPPVIIQDYNISQGEALPSGAFLDGHVYEGTTYVYEVVVADSNTGARRLVASATAVSLDNHLPPRRARSEYLGDKYGGRQPQYLSFMPRADFLVDTYVLHGVQVRVAFEKAIVSTGSALGSGSGSSLGSRSGSRASGPRAGFLRGASASADDDDDSVRARQRRGSSNTVSKHDAGVFALREATVFHRLRVMFGSFPVSEYRIAVHSNGTLTSENELGTGPARQAS